VAHPHDAALAAAKILQALSVPIHVDQQAFVRDLTTAADDASIVSAVISMGESLHMRVVAEGRPDG
jgi:EAL domain-containing protein (putative c-di-GMP-specific phosphodiesterase class I)